MQFEQNCVASLNAISKKEGYTGSHGSSSFFHAGSRPGDRSTFDICHHVIWKKVSAHKSCYRGYSKEGDKIDQTQWDKFFSDWTIYNDKNMFFIIMSKDVNTQRERYIAQQKA